MLFRHPRAVCMTYCTHFVFAMRLSVRFGVAALQLMMHAVFPDAYVAAATDAIKDVDAALRTAGCRD